MTLFYAISFTRLQKGPSSTIGAFHIYKHPGHLPQRVHHRPGDYSSFGVFYNPEAW